MIITIKFNEKTSDENQMFVLDMNKHYQIFALEDNINNYVSNTSTWLPPDTPTPKIDLSKYDGFEVYGIFKSYSRIDGFSIFEIDTLQIDRDYKLKQLLQ
jgi:hypothetical protein